MYYASLIAWIPFGIISLFWARASLFTALNELVVVLIAVLISVSTIIFLKETKAFIKYFNLWILSIITLLPVGLWEIITQNHLSSVKYEQAIDRVYRFAPSTVYYNTNDFALYLIFSITILYVTLKYAKSLIWSIILSALLITSIYVLANTMSRISYLTLSVILIFDMLYIGRKKILSSVLKPLVLMIVIIPVVVMYFNEETVSMINIISTGIISMREDVIYGNTRFNIMYDGFKILKNTYLMGGGPATIASPHNFILEILFDYGIIMLGLWLITLYNIIRSLYNITLSTVDRNSKRISNTLLLCNIGFVVGSVGPSSVLPILPVWFIIGASIAWILAYQRGGSEISNES